MRGWINIGGDVNWQDYGAKWARRGRDGSWYVVCFNNMIEACGERDAAEMGYVYEAAVQRADLRELSNDQIKDALDSCGFKLTADGAVDMGAGDLVTDPKEIEALLVEAVTGYGIYAPLDTFTGKVRPANVRANARRRAEWYMRDAVALETALDKTVNRIGTTAREFGRGDALAGLKRYAAEGRHGTNPVRDLMLKIYRDADTKR
jgi:hypothetical protein